MLLFTLTLRNVTNIEQFQVICSLKDTMWANPYCGMLQDDSRAAHLVYNSPLQQISTDLVLPRQPCSYERFRRRPISQRPSQQTSYRATINPSKRHRDRLNQELENLSRLLPLPEDVIARLDKLSVLRLSVSYLQNKNFHKKGCCSKPAQAIKDVVPPMAVAKPTGLFTQLFNEAIDGFMIVLTYTGVIFYISESVKSHLGYSQSQYLHQSLYSYIHDDDHEELRAGLQQYPQQKVIELMDDESEANQDVHESSQPREFVLRMKSILNSSSSDMYKPFKLSGHMRRLDYMLQGGQDQYGLFAMCTPVRPSGSMLEIRIKSTLFCSKNRLDLSFLDMDARGKEFFGYSKKDIAGRSSYVMVHRADMQHLRCKHTEIKYMGRTTTATFRLLCKSTQWTWICGYAKISSKNHKEDFVVTTNRLMSDEEGDAMLKIRDAEDLKSLQNLGINRNELKKEEAENLGFPLSSNFNLSEIDAGPMHNFQTNAGFTDDILSEKPEELFDVSEDLLKSSPENILSSPEDFSDAFDMSPSSLVHDAPYASTMRHANGMSTTCASVRSDSISTVSDISMEQQMFAHYQRQQSTGSNTSPSRQEASYNHIKDKKQEKKNSLANLAKTLDEMNVNAPPNVMAPMENSNPFLEIAVLDANLFKQNALSSAPTRQISPPQSHGRSLTDLTHSSPQQRGFQSYDAFQQNAAYFSPSPNTCEYRPMDFKTQLNSDRSNRQSTILYPSNTLQSCNSDGLNFGSGFVKQAQTGLHVAPFNMERAPNVTITTPECNIQDLRTSIAANNRSESSPSYPFLSPLSPTVNWSNNQMTSSNNGTLDAVDQISAQNYNSLQSSQHKIYQMSRQIHDYQQQQQQGHANGFPTQYFSNDQMQQFRDVHTVHLG